MARSKQQWRAEKKRALLLAARAPVSSEEMVKLKAEHPQLRADVPQAAVTIAISSEATAPTAAPSSVIDLTEEEDEEMGVMAREKEEEEEEYQSEQTQAVPEAGRPSIEEASNNVMDISSGQHNADEESDVDEAWPEMEAVNREERADTPETQELVDDEDAGGGEGGDNGDSSVPDQERASQQDAGPAAVVTNVLMLDEDEMEEDEALPIVKSGSAQLASGDHPTTNADTTAPTPASGGEDPAVTQPATDWAGRILRIVQAAALEEENLEDGEIFEEGAVVTSPTSVKRVIALERLASREDSGSDASQQLPHQQGKKKHKKRGKKKSKRKLEAMMMGSAAPGTPPIGFERITRPHPIVSEPAASYDNVSPPVAVMPAPPPPPPPLFVALPPPQPSMPPGMPRTIHASANYHQYGDVPPPSMPPFPPYEDNQILRVSRQGGVEMFSGDGRMMPVPSLSPSHVTAPPGHGIMGGGFKYRSIPPRMPPPPPMMRHVQQPHSTESSAASSPAPSFESPPFRRDNRLGSLTSTTSSADPEEPADDGVDLDMLRALALRTKRASRSQPSTQPEAAAAPTNAVESGSKQLGAASGSGGAIDKPSSEANGTDNLDEDALLAMIRSSQKRKRSQKQGHPAADTGIATQSGDNVPPTDAEQPRQAKESAVTTDRSKDCDDETMEDALPVSAVHVSSVDAHSTSKAPSPASSSKESTTGETMLTELPPTPVVRPLTACSQSLVIQLDEDDLMLADDDDAAVLNSPHSSAAPSQNVKDIRSAIDAMRRQIAEREKARAGGNKGGEPSSSSASSSSSTSSSSPSSNSLRSSPRSDGQKKAEMVAKASTAATATRGIQVVTTLPVSSLSSSSSSPSSLPSPAALQAEIRAMKERIAAKEREKRQHEQQRQFPTPSPREPTARATEEAATLAMKGGGGDPDTVSARPTPSEAASLLERYRNEYEACKAEMEKSRRELALVDAEVARLERELAAASSASSPAQAHAVDARG